MKKNNKQGLLIQAALSLRKEVKIAFVISLASILLKDLFLLMILVDDKWLDNLGEIYLKICYSILASTIFFFINQQIPKQQKKNKIKLILENGVQYIELSILGFNKNLGIEDNCISYNEIEACSRLINLHDQTSLFIFPDMVYSTTWYDYLNEVTKNISNRITFIISFHENLDASILDILLRIQNHIQLFPIDKRINWADRTVAPYTRLISALGERRQELLKARSSNKLY